MIPRSQWAEILARDPGHSQRYIDRFAMLAAQGQDLVGEARLVDAIVGRGAAILDAGCGPGRHCGYLHAAGHRVVGVDLDPAQHGYVKVNDSQFENGWHPGQNDDPKAMSQLLRLNGIHRFLWDVSGVGQFDVRFDLYIHEEIKDELDKARQLLAKRP